MGQAMAVQAAVLCCSPAAAAIAAVACRSLSHCHHSPHSSLTLLLSPRHRVRSSAEQSRGEEGQQQRGGAAKLRLGVYFCCGWPLLVAAAPFAARDPCPSALLPSGPLHLPVSLSPPSSLCGLLADRIGFLFFLFVFLFFFERGDFSLGRLGNDETARGRPSKHRNKRVETAQANIYVQTNNFDVLHC